MFDRGLTSLSDELDILVSRQVNDPEWGPRFDSLQGERWAINPRTDW